MAFRRILLPITGTAAGESALHTALTVAQIWNAHVHCLHVRVDARDVAPLAGEGLSGAMIEEMMAATEREARMREAIVKARNHTTAQGNSFRQWYDEIQAILNAALSPAKSTEEE